jgi:hypothetical protein
MPGESPQVFGDALRRLAASATYLYQDGPRYWYSTQPTVIKLAEDRAEQLNRDPDKVNNELDSRLRLDLRNMGNFGRIHAMPQSGADVPDDLDARLVVLRVDQPYSKEKGNAAEAAAKKILESRGSTPRIYRNTLVFLAADKTRLQDLDEATRKYLAWESILNEKDQLDLSPLQVKQAETQKAAANNTVTARLPETYQWLLVPVQHSPKDAITWEAIRLSGQDALAVRASKKLRNDELLITTFSATRLRIELDKIPLWRGNHVTIKQLIEDFARYPYLPRLKSPEVIIDVIKDGVSLLTWSSETFAYADLWEEDQKRYLGLRADGSIHISLDNNGILIKPGAAMKQMDADRIKQREKIKEGSVPGLQDEETCREEDKEEKEPEKPRKPVRFYGAVELDTTRISRDAGKITEEVIQHLTALSGCKAEVSLEIHIEVAEGVPENVVRTVTENCRTLKFKTQGFDTE